MVKMQMGDNVSSATKAVELMRFGDLDGQIDQFVERQLRAEGMFRERAYVAWPAFPDHPAAPALAAFVRYSEGQQVDAAAFRGLSWIGYLLTQHEQDWSNCEANLGARLRSPENFRGCIFELEASVLLRRHSHSTVWLWPRRPAEGDLVVDDDVFVDCIHAADATGLRVSPRLGAQLASAAVNAMDKYHRDIHVRLTVSDTLYGRDIGPLRDAITAAIRSSAVGSVQLPFEGYSVQIDDLSQDGGPLPVEEAKMLFGGLSNKPYHWGHVRESPIHPYGHPRLFSIEQLTKDNAVAAAARVAAQKHEQLGEGRPNLVCVKFGHLVSRDQVLRSDLQSIIVGVSQAALREYGWHGAHRVGGVLWVFETGVVFPEPGRGIIDEDERPTGPSQVCFLVSNPDAAVPLPARFWESG